MFQLAILVIFFMNTLNTCGLTTLRRPCYNIEFKYGPATYWRRTVFLDSKGHSNQMSHDEWNQTSDMLCR